VPRLASRIFDVLETDGGWLTAEGIGLELVGDIGAAQVADALYGRLRNRVERRSVGLASSNGRGPNEARTEWRAKQ
jgi:hypothetical protein